MIVYLARDIHPFVMYYVNSINVFLFPMEIHGYIYKDRKNILKMNKEVRMLLPKKDLIQVE